MSGFILITSKDRLLESKCISLSFRSPGYGVSLVAETTTGVMIASDSFNSHRQQPEDFGKDAALHLIDEFFYV
jgi:RNA 3'-terminal phosphate cyclase